MTRIDFDCKLNEEYKVKRDNVWWGDYSLDVGETLSLEVGEIRFTLHRQELEWRFAVIERAQEEQEQWQLTRSKEIVSDSDQDWERYVGNPGDKPLYIRPGLADRSVVSRPRTAFSILPGQDIRIFLSTPLWAQIRLKEKELTLKEFSLQPLSDTWFGTSTLEGELCYATRTHARLMPGEIPHYPHRATTVVTVKNRAQSLLLVERFNLPVTYLGLYQNRAGELWTEAIELVREEENESAVLRIMPGPPIDMEGVERIADPRKRSNNGLLVRALDSLFG